MAVVEKFWHQLVQDVLEVVVLMLDHYLCPMSVGVIFIRIESVLNTQEHILQSKFSVLNNFSLLNLENRIVSWNIA